MVQGMKLTVGAAKPPVNYDQARDAWVATVPVQGSPTYSMIVLSEDLSGLLTKTLDVILTANGQALRATVVNGNASPVPGVLLRAKHASGLADNGLANEALTGADGVAVMFLDAGTYNLLVRSPGFKDEVMQTVQVAGGLTDFDMGGAQFESHALRDSAGAAVAGARVAITKPAVLPHESSLVAVRTTDVAGLWTANLDAATGFKFVLSKPGFDSVMAEVESIG